MPLRASLDESEIQSFNYSQDEWLELKKTYKNKSLLMPCCQRKAIPKTSKLGVQYFAHARRGECTSSPETAEHIHLKYLIAKTAQEAGWSVTTERPGTTPEGENWIADVFCEKGAAKLAFEVQWSYQTNDEYVRRTEKYRRSGVRCAWLFRLKTNKEYYHGDFIESYDLPYFGFKQKDEEYIVSRFDVTVEEFVSGMLNGKLSWLPRENDLISSSIHFFWSKCWRCKKITNMITGVDFFYDDVKVGRLAFTEEEGAKWIFNNLPPELLAKNRIGEIKARYSKTVQGAYLSNGCYHCSALQGNFFVASGARYEGRHIRLHWRYNPAEARLDERWFFNKSSGNYFY